MAYLRGMGGQPPIITTHRYQPMKALIAYALFGAVALSTANYIAEGMAEGLRLQQAERAAQMEAAWN